MSAHIGGERLVNPHGKRMGACPMTAQRYIGYDKDSQIFSYDNLAYDSQIDAMAYPRLSFLSVNKERKQR